jgi:hypothetical protein
MNNKRLFLVLIGSLLVLSVVFSFNVINDNDLINKRENYNDCIIEVVGSTNGNVDTKKIEYMYDEECLFYKDKLDDLLINDEIELLKQDLLEQKIINNDLQNQINSLLTRINNLEKSSMVK